MAQYLEEAQAMRDEIVAHRRYLHQHAELGFALTETVDYVCRTLRGYGYEPRLLGGGVTCTVGSGAPVILLRGEWMPCRKRRNRESPLPPGPAHAIPAATTPTPPCCLAPRS